jgi:hypothetical protein
MPMLVSNFIRSAPPVCELVDPWTDPSRENAFRSLAAVRMRNRRVGDLEAGVEDWIRSERMAGRQADQARSVIREWEDRGHAVLSADGFVAWDNEVPFFSERAATFRDLVCRAAGRIGKSFGERLAAVRAIMSVCSEFAVHEGTDERGCWTSFTVHSKDLEKMGEHRREWFMTTESGWVGLSWRRINYVGDLDEWLVLGTRDHARDQMQEILAVEGELQRRLERFSGRRWSASVVAGIRRLVVEATAVLVVATERVSGRMNPAAKSMTSDFHAFGYSAMDGTPWMTPSRTGAMRVNDAPLRLLGVNRPGNFVEWLSDLDEEHFRRLSQAATLFPNCIPDLARKFDDVVAGGSVPELLSSTLLGSKVEDTDEIRIVAQVARRMHAYKSLLSAEAKRVDPQRTAQLRRDEVFRPLSMLVRVAGTDAILDQPDEEGRRTVVSLARSIAPFFVGGLKQGLPDKALLSSNFTRALSRDHTKIVDLVRAGVFDTIDAVCGTLESAFAIARLEPIRPGVLRVLAMQSFVGRDGGVKQLVEANRVWHRDVGRIQDQLSLLRSSAGGARSPTGRPTETFPEGRLRWLLDGPALAQEGEKMKHCIRYSLKSVLLSNSFVASVMADDGSRSTVKFMRGKISMAEMVPGSESLEFLPVVQEHRSAGNRDPSDGCLAIVEDFLSSVQAGGIPWLPDDELLDRSVSSIEEFERWHPTTRPSDVLAAYGAVFGPKLSKLTVDDWWRMANEGAA